MPAGTIEQLIEAARSARERAHAPFSKFKVGATVGDEDGRIYSGCNVESASYGLTMCAERVAVFRAISEGASKLVRIAVVADTERLTPPCGACRQILWEFLGDGELILANLSGATERLRISQIFPRPFDRSFL
ncbi:MAG TPA: cytidine deaminase [Bryobacteraceae bacterium]